MAANVNRLSVSNMNYTVKGIYKAVANGTITFDNVVQRSYTWENARRSELIWSLIMNYPIPPIYAGRDIKGDNKVLDLMDGKQRVTTLYKFLNDEFALTDLAPIPCVDEKGNPIEEDISGKRFSELNEELQDLIRDRSIVCYYYDDITQEQKRELFKRLNNGKPLTAKNRALASCKNIDEVLEVSSHEVFKEMLSDKALENKNQAIIAVKTWYMAFYDLPTVSFDSKTLNASLEEIEMTDEEKEIMNEVYDLIQSTHQVLIDKGQKKVAKKLYTELHFVSLIPFFIDVLNKNLSSPDETMSEWLIKFFDAKASGSSISEEYNAAASNGVNKNSAIIARYNALNSSYNNFFGVESIEENEAPDNIEDVNKIELEKETNEETVENSDDQNSFEDNMEPPVDSNEEIIDEDTADIEEYEGDPDMAKLVDELLGQDNSLDDIWG